MEMSTSMKTLTLLEQKRIQWAKEREEMVGLCGLWGHPKYRNEHLTRSEDQRIEELPNKRNNLLPPIPVRNQSEEGRKLHHNFRTEEESETSGYLSDSPKHFNEKEPSIQDNSFKEEPPLSPWYEKGENKDSYSADNSDGVHSARIMDRKSYKNYRNEKWTKHSFDAWQYNSGRNSKNWWFGTPESVSSEDGNRLKWGDRGVGIGHLWEPVVHQPDSRLPQLESYRPTPKWVERGLRQSDSSQKADILIIHHPDDDQYKTYSSDSQTQKNFLLGQNVRLTPDVIEEREKKRRRALEHQNAIRQQLEDRERKRKEERQNKLREERLEEERIKREQETEKLRLEEEQRRSREKEEKEKRKEEAMKEAIELAEKKAREEKKHQRKHYHQMEEPTSEKVLEPPELVKTPAKTPKSKPDDGLECRIKTSRTEKLNSVRQVDRMKARKDSSSQFEQMRIPNGVQFLNMNNLPMDGSLALVLDNPQAENGFLVPSDGMQLALLMSPGQVNSGQIIPLTTPIPSTMTPRGRVLTPSKFRPTVSAQAILKDKTTQTEGMCCSTSVKSSSRSLPRSRKQTRRSGRNSGGSDTSEKSNSLERPPQAQYQISPPAKYRSRSQPRYSLDDRPKWGINRPSVQYKKQSEKDIYYQKKIRQRLKKTNDVSTSTENSPKIQANASEQVEEKLLESEMRLLRCETDEDDGESRKVDSVILRNGYRMKSNPSSPLFVPIDSARTEKSEDGKDFLLELSIEPNSIEEKEEAEEDSGGEKEEVEEVQPVGFEEEPMPGSIGYVTQTQLESIRQIASLREGLQKLQLDFSSSRSITPYSDKNE